MSTSDDERDFVRECHETAAALRLAADRVRALREVLHPQVDIDRPARPVLTVIEGGDER